jgi:hypothetical protein
LVYRTAQLNYYNMTRKAHRCLIESLKIELPVKLSPRSLNSKVVVMRLTLTKL